MQELSIYGAGRLGVLSPTVRQDRGPFYATVSASNISVLGATRTLDQKRYEITDHLGNVRVVITDRKEPQGTGFTPTIVSVANFYPFGMEQPGRTWQAGDYRYGYNGMERDDNLKGQGNSYATPFRMNDPRLAGRWWSTDPITKPWESPYAGYGNNPVSFIDPLGLDEHEQARHNIDGGGGDNTTAQPLERIKDPAPKPTKHAADATNPNAPGSAQKIPQTAEVSKVAALPFQSDLHQKAAAAGTSDAKISATPVTLTLAQDLIANDPGANMVNDFSIFGQHLFGVEHPVNLNLTYASPDELQKAGLWTLITIASAGIGAEARGVAAEVKTLGDLTVKETKAIQNIVNSVGRPIEVVGSAAKGTRRGVGTNMPFGKGPGTRSDIDYVVPPGSLPYYRGVKLPEIDPASGVGLGPGNPYQGPIIRFEPYTPQRFVPFIP